MRIELVKCFKAGVKREPLDAVKARKLAYYGKFGNTMRKQLRELPGERDNARNNAWMDNINMWTGLPVEELIRVTEDKVRT